MSTNTTNHKSCTFGQKSRAFLSFASKITKKMSKVMKKPLQAIWTRFHFVQFYGSKFLMVNACTANFQWLVLKHHRFIFN